MCDVLNKTSANSSLIAEASVALEHSYTYFVTVIAVNGAGLSTIISTDGVTIDRTAPVVQGFSILSSIKSNENTSNSLGHLRISHISTRKHDITATWDYIGDDESNIKHISVCAGKRNETCDLREWQRCGTQASSCILHFPTNLRPGDLFVLRLSVKNGAGLMTFAQTGKVLVDTSSPNVGTIQINGQVNGRNNVILLQHGQPIRVSWQGFEDAETNIREYQWKICYAAQTDSCLNNFVNVDLRTSITFNDTGIEHGVEYRVAVKAANFAGLETKSFSNSFILDKTPPDIGKITTISRNGYQSSTSQVSVAWKGFYDAESGISRYEVCVGTMEGVCDVSAYRSVGLSTATVVRNLNLTQNATYFTTVQVTNGAGQTSFSSASGTTIDQTPPVGGSTPRDGSNGDQAVTLKGIYIEYNWDEFSDPESGIWKYVICAGTVEGACDLSLKVTVVDVLKASLRIGPDVSSGTKAYSTLWVYNNAGGVVERYSNGVLLDGTPPENGNVRMKSHSFNRYLPCNMINFKLDFIDL